MEPNLIIRKFEAMGAMAKIRPLAWNRQREDFPVTFDVRRTKEGQVFDIAYSPRADFNLSVIDLRKDMKHLLLLLKVPGETNERKLKVLCGHDEREWFFIPTGKAVLEGEIRYKEPLSRGGRSKPHIVDECITFGGELV